MEAALQSPDADSFDLVASAVAHPARRQLLHLVRDNEQAAGDLATRFPDMSRPAVSQHLRLLEHAGLVSVRRDRNRRLYRARPEGLTAMRAFIDEMWTDRLARHRVGVLVVADRLPMAIEVAL
jgi:DNA-binding transcriptional ArsR family regulator